MEKLLSPPRRCVCMLRRARVRERKEKAKRIELKES
jgi:hypothetical protein